MRAPAAVVASLLILAAALAGAGEISVTGEAEVRVVPDEVIVVLGVETFNRELRLAKEANDRVVAAVLDVARRHHVPDEHIQTDYIQVEPRYRNSGPENELLGYAARSTVEVTLRKLDHFETLLSESLEAGANYVHGIDFRTTELRTYRDQARDLAIKAAREKAVDLAAALGETIGRPTKIGEGWTGWGSGYGSWWGRGRGGSMSQNVVQSVGSGGSMGPVAPGQIAVTARVSVTFELSGEAASPQGGSAPGKE
jgi:uncharacterized protein